MIEPTKHYREARKHDERAQELRRRAKGKADAAEIKKHAEWHEMVAVAHRFHANPPPRTKDD